MASIHEHIVSGKVILGYIPTTLMAADIFTKFYPQGKSETWKAVVRLVGVYAGTNWKDDFGKMGGGHEIAVERQHGVDRKSCRRWHALSRLMRSHTLAATTPSLKTSCLLLIKNI